MISCASLDREVLSLSSGTMATICRQYGLLHEYQLSLCEFIDAVQSRFALFCTTKRAADCQSWHEAAAKYADWFHTIHQRRWIGAYQGSRDYVIDGQTYEANYSKDKNTAWNTDVWDGFTKTVGTIYYRYNMTKGFPPDDVISAFPELVPVKATQNPWTYVYDDRFGHPVQCWGQRGWDKDHLQTHLLTNWDRVRYEGDPKLQYLKRHYR